MAGFKAAAAVFLCFATAIFKRFLLSFRCNGPRTKSSTISSKPQWHKIRQVVLRLIWVFVLRFLAFCNIWAHLLLYRATKATAVPEPTVRAAGHSKGDVATKVSELLCLVVAFCVNCVIHLINFCLACVCVSYCQPTGRPSLRFRTARKMAQRFKWGRA